MAIRRYSRRSSSRTYRSSRGRRSVGVPRRSYGTRRRRTYSATRATRRSGRAAEVKVCSGYDALTGTPDPVYPNRHGLLRLEMGGTWWNSDANAALPVNPTDVGTTYSGTAPTQLLTGVPAGYAGDERVGLAISPRQLSVRIGVNALRMRRNRPDPEAPSSTGDPQFVRTRYRFLIVSDKEFSPQFTGGWAGLVTPLNLFAPLGDGTMQANYPQYSTLAFLRNDLSTRFHIHADRSIIVDRDDPTGEVHININLRGKQLRWYAAGREAVRAGHLYLVPLFQVDELTVASTTNITYNPTLHVNSRLSYTDN